MAVVSVYKMGLRAELTGSTSIAIQAYKDEEIVQPTVIESVRNCRNPVESVMLIAYPPGLPF